MHASEALVVAILIQLALIVPLARVGGWAARKLKQPRSVGEIVVGLMLGPSLFGLLAPDLSASVFPASANDAMRAISQVGLILLMFQIGSDFEFGHLKDKAHGRATLLVSIISVSVPFLIGVLMGWGSAPILAAKMDPTAYTLFVGIAFAITAVPILGRILREYGLNKHPIGVIAISSAAANDAVGWLGLAAIATYVSASFDPSSMLIKIVGLLALLAFLWTVGRRIIDWLMDRFPVEHGEVPPTLLAIILPLIFVAGIATEELGIFTIFGGFLVGLLCHRHTAFVQAWRVTVGQFVLVFFLPIFFTFTGLRTNLLGLDSMSDWLWCAAMITAAVLAKIIPVTVAARAAGMNSNASMTLGVLMNTRALMELIVLNIGLQMGVLPPDVFTMLVLMAVVSTLMTAPLLRILLRRQGMPAEPVQDA
jgi:Kef-type K+ transport system membrane component KefB